MTVQSYPMMLSAYKGEGRILINPLIEHVAGYFIDSDCFVNVQEQDFLQVGRGVIQAINFIKKSPLSTLTLEELEADESWKGYTKYKSRISFWKNNYFARLKLYEDGHYEIFSMTKSEKRKGTYSKIIKEVNLSSESTVEDIGKAVLDVMAASEKYYANRTVSKNISSKTIALPDGTNLTIEHPKDRHFTDLEDAHAAEIYQCYSYIPKKNAEASAEFFLGMAAELDCSLEMENVRSTWEELYGKPDFFDMQETESGIFKLRFEMKNKDIHKISHFLQIEEDLLLECSMEVHSPNKRKKLDEDLTKLFAEFAGSCRLLTEL